MAFLQEIPDDKEKLLRFFLSDSTLVDLLNNSENTPLPCLNMRYTQVFPYHWLSSTISEEKSFLCFTVLPPSTVSPTIEDVEITIFVFTHENLMRTPKGARIDLLASSVDSLLNGSLGFGIGKVGRKTMRPISPAKDFYGYEMKYLVKDFNRSFSEIRERGVVS